MTTSAAKPKSAVDTLTKSFNRLVSQAKKRMSPKDFKRAEQKFDQVTSKVRSSRAPRRQNRPLFHS